MSEPRFSGCFFEAQQFRAAKLRARSAAEPRTLAKSKEKIPGCWRVLHRLLVKQNDEKALHFHLAPKNAARIF